MLTALKFGKAGVWKSGKSQWWKGRIGRLAEAVCKKLAVVLYSLTGGKDLLLQNFAFGAFNQSFYIFPVAYNHHQGYGNGRQQ